MQAGQSVLPVLLALILAVALAVAVTTVITAVVVIVIIVIVVPTTPVTAIVRNRDSDAAVRCIQGLVTHFDMKGVNAAGALSGAFRAQQRLVRPGNNRVWRSVAIPQAILRLVAGNLGKVPAYGAAGIVSADDPRNRAHLVVRRPEDVGTGDDGADLRRGRVLNHDGRGTHDDIGAVISDADAHVI